MSGNVLVPRWDEPTCRLRLKELVCRLDQGVRGEPLVSLSLKGAIWNPNGGREPTEDDLARWRMSVLESIDLRLLASPKGYSRFGWMLGCALEEVLHPIPGDVAHEEAWAFLSLAVFPDLVAARWYENGNNAYRWLGTMAGRDRGFLKQSWKRWLLFRDVIPRDSVALGEDQFQALTERTSVCRNVRLVRFVASELIEYGKVGSQTMAFGRILMTRLTAQTGSRNLNALDDSELRSVVRSAAQCVSRELG